MEIEEYLAGLPGRLAHRPVTAREPISAAAIHTWCDAMGERNPGFTGPNPVAPPATLQMWTFPGLAPDRPRDAGPADPGDLDGEVRSRLAEHGFTATLATSTTQEVHRPLRPGDLPRVRDRFTAVSSRKRTALGEGYFVSSRAEYTVDEVVVGHLDLTVLHFRPAPAGELPPPATPVPESWPPPRARPAPRRVGAPLEPVRLALTPTLVIAGALATRDFYPVHHDRDFARAHGNPDILLNILTTNGLLARLAGEWSGGTAVRLATRLRAPAYAHHTLTVEGSVVAVDGERMELAVRAGTAIGPHAEAVISTVPGPPGGGW